MRSIALIPSFFLLLASLGSSGQDLEGENAKEAFMDKLMQLRDVESFSYRASSSFKWLPYPEGERDSLFGQVVVHRDPGDSVFGARFRGNMTRVRKAKSEADTTRTEVHYDGEHLLKYYPGSKKLTIYRAADAKKRLTHFARILKKYLLNPSFLLERSERIEVKGRGREELAEGPSERFQFLLRSDRPNEEPFYMDWSFGPNGQFPVRMKDSVRHKGNDQKHTLRIRDLSLDQKVLEKVPKVDIDSGDPESYSAALELMVPEGMPQDSIEVEYFDPSEYKESEEERRARLNSVDPAPSLKGLPFPIDKEQDSTVLEAPFDSELVLLDFWYMDCPPCLKAIPHLNELHEEYAGQGLRIVGVDPMDEAERMKERWSNFSEHNPIDYQILLTGKQTADRYKMRGYPTLFLFDGEGELLMAEQGFQKESMKELEEKIREHLDRKKEEDRSGWKLIYPPDDQSL